MQNLHKSKEGNLVGNHPKIEKQAEMKRSIIRSKGSAIAVAAIALHGLSFTQQADGATIVQTQSFNVKQADFNLVFSRFNASLGTLTGVSITLQYQRSGGYLGVDNEGASSATVSFTHNTNILVDVDNEILDWSRLSGGTRLLSILSNRSTTTLTDISVGADTDGEADYSGSDYYRYNLETINMTSSGAGSFANIAQFGGTGNISVPVTVTQSNSITGAGASAQNFDPATVAGTFTITYTYEAIPEPSVAVVSAMSLGMLCLRRRRVRQA